MPQRHDPAARAAERTAFDHYLRTGETLGEPARRALRAACERKFNPNHDPKDGRFTSGPGGPRTHSRKAPRLPETQDPTKKAHYYQGRTKNGLGAIKPKSGGYMDAGGRYVPEVFAADPYSLETGAEALKHYETGGGQPMNFYANDIDISPMGVDSFKDIQSRLKSGTPGTFMIQDAQGSFDTTGHPTPGNLAAGAIVGGVVPVANGVLTIGKDGGYTFSGWVGFHEDDFKFHERSGRGVQGNVSNFGGEQVRGKRFFTYIVGTKSFVRRGRTR